MLYLACINTYELTHFKDHFERYFKNHFSDKEALEPCSVSCVKQGQTLITAK